MFPFKFPVWVFVNLRRKAPDGYPYYFLTRGGTHGTIETGLPLTLPVFRTRETAIKVTEPFSAIEIDEDQLREILREARDIEDICFEMGTPEASLIRVEMLHVD